MVGAWMVKLTTKAANQSIMKEDGIAIGGIIASMWYLRFDRRPAHVVFA